MTVKDNAATERVQRIKDMYVSGKSLAEIGRECGVSRQRIHQILKGSENFDEMKKSHEGNKKSKEKNQLNDAIKDGLDYDQMAEAYGKSRAYWYNLAKATGKDDLVNTFAKKSMKRQQEIIEYLKAGHTQQEAAEKFGTAQTNISRIALRHDYHSRGIKMTVCERNNRIAYDYASGEYTRAQLAEKYGVSPSTIGVAIAQNKKWISS